MYPAFQALFPKLSHIEEAQYGFYYNGRCYTDSRKLTSSDDWVLISNADWVNIYSIYDNDARKLYNATMHHNPIFWSCTQKMGNHSGLSIIATGIINRTSLIRELRSHGVNSTRSNTFLRTSDTEQTAARWMLALGGFMAQGNWIDGSHSGYSIRFRKVATTLDEGEMGTYTGNDGKEYATIVFHGIEFMKQNLAETKFRNGDDVLYDGYLETHEADEWVNASYPRWSVVQHNDILYESNHSFVFNHEPGVSDRWQVITDHERAYWQARPSFRPMYRNGVMDFSLGYKYRVPEKMYWKS